MTVSQADHQQRPEGGQPPGGGARHGPYPAVAGLFAQVATAAETAGAAPFHHDGEEPMTDANCFDLRGRGCRVQNESHGRKAHERDDSWNLIIPGRAGFVTPWGYLPPRGSGLLVACTNSSVTTRRLLAAVPGARVVQDGSDGQAVTFAPEHLDVVAGLLGLWRKRVLSAEQRARLVEAGQASRFSGAGASEKGRGAVLEPSEGVGAT
jgi:hypothetical protein